MHRVNRALSMEDLDNALRNSPTRRKERPVMKVTEEMVTRFLGWKLPQTFAPDGGVTFKPPENPHLWPVGTNILTATEARAMLEHVLADAP